MHPILFPLLLTPALPPAATQPRPSYFDQPAILRSIGRARGGERAPLIVIPPATGASASTIYDALAPHVGGSALLALVPAGRPQRSDYSPDFYAYVKWFEQRLALDRASLGDAVDPSRIYMAGFSLGGDLAWALLTRHPEWISGVLILSSGCSAGLSPAAAATLARRHVRVVFVIGDADPRKPGLLRAHARLLMAHVPTQVISFRGGHDLPHDGSVLDRAFRELFKP